MAKPKRMSTAQRDLNDRPHVLYKFWNAQDVLLYVGITVDSPTRIANHMRAQPWWHEVETIKFTTYPTRAEALAAEAEMIRTLKPLYNVVHNEMVDAEQETEVESAEDDDTTSLADLPCMVLSELDSDERDYLLREHARDYDGNPRAEADVELHAATDAVSSMSYDRLRFKRLIDELMDYLPSTAGGGYLELARADLEEWQQNGAITRFDIARVALEYYVDFRARKYLEGLGAEQAEEWRERIRAIHGGDPTDLDRRAASDAHARHASGWYDKRGCLLPGTRGALCPRLVGARIWYEICPLCTNGRACEGHEIFCVEHAEQAASGDLGFLERTRLGAFPVLRWERTAESLLVESRF